MKKFRFVSFIICVFLAVPYITVFADNAYYTYQNQYAAAQQSGDLYAMAAAVKGIESVYAYPSSKDEYNRLAWHCQTLAQLYEMFQMKMPTIYKELQTVRATDIL